MKVIFACAGSGGHVNPAIAIANIILKKNADSKVLFIGTENGLENQLVEKAGFEIKHIRTGKLIRKFTFKNIKSAVDTYNGISDAKKIILDFKPDLIIGTGGYISGPVMLAARSLKIPYILHESNAFPGIAVKMLAKNASKVLIGFEDARKRLKNRTNIVYTGTPAKFNKIDIEKLDKQTCKKELGLEHIDKKIILVMCGSQGAKKINDTILEMLKNELNDKIYIILATGNKNYEEVIEKKNEIQKELKEDLDKYIKIEKYIYDMDKIYKVSDLCITRSGAMTITELEIVGKPSILIPLPSAAENHQLYNAKVLEAANGGVIIEQKDLSYKLLSETIKELTKNNKLYEMSKNLNTLIVENVEEKIYECIKEVVQKK